ncbi:MAG: DUF433 domain-containing protein [Gemmatimonadota bacterium]
MSGTPVFTGTRVPVESLIDHIKGGDTLEDFLVRIPGREPRAGRRLPRARSPGTRALRSDRARGPGPPPPAGRYLRAPSRPFPAGP